MSHSIQFHGVYSPVLTPFHADLTPDSNRFVRHCRWLLDQEVGLSVFGTNSEATSLSLTEKRMLLDTLIAAGLPASRIMPGTGSCAASDVIELTRHAVEIGCSSVLMLPPFYYKGVSDEGLFRAFANIIEGVADERLRIFLYHIPPVTQIPLSLALIDRLMTAYPGIIAGVKDSSGDWSNTHSLIERFAPRGLNVLAGNENFLLETMRAGGAGCITATGNVNPGPIVELYKNWQAQDADAQQARLDVTRAAFTQFPLIAAMKAAIAMKTGNSDWSIVRPPLVELDASQYAELEASLNRVGFTMPNAEALA